MTQDFARDYFARNEARSKCRRFVFVGNPIGSRRTQRAIAADCIDCRSKFLMEHAEQQDRNCGALAPI